jgi:hypothetical protein
MIFAALVHNVSRPAAKNFKDLSRSCSCRAQRDVEKATEDVGNLPTSKEGVSITYSGTKKSH